MILVTLSVIISVISLNLHNRSVETHIMSPWTRWIFLEKLPYILLMKRPKVTRASFPRAKKKADSKRSSKNSLVESFKMK